MMMESSGVFGVDTFRGCAMLAANAMSPGPLPPFGVIAACKIGPPAPAGELAAAAP